MTPEEIEAFRLVFRRPAPTEEEHAAFARDLSDGPHRRLNQEDVTERLAARVARSEAGESDKALVLGVLARDWRNTRNLALLSSSAAAAAYR